MKKRSLIEGRNLYVKIFFCNIYEGSKIDVVKILFTFSKWKFYL